MGATQRRAQPQTLSRWGTLSEKASRQQKKGSGVKHSINRVKE
jgi:hypothetical protein